MATKAQIYANRRNAEKSTGPKTTEGKETVSQNAVKHGLTARKTVIPGESKGDFCMYHYEMLEELDPLGPMESMLADRIISLSWRLKRTVRIQDETIEALCTPKPPSPLDKLTKSLIYKSIGQSPPDQPESEEPPTLGQVAMKDFSYARVLDRLMMYERRIENSLYKTINELQKLKLIRKLGASPTTRVTSSAAESRRAGNLSGLTSQTAQPDSLSFMQNKPNLYRCFTRRAGEQLGNQSSINNDQSKLSFLRRQ
jgi:hypothetical protein